MPNIFPLFIRKANAKVKWFFKNYKSIQYDSEIFNSIHGPMTYNTDGLATSNNCDFINDPRFDAAYQSAKATNPWPNFTLMWRIHIVCWLAEYAKHFEGDFVECGVNTGSYARAIIEYINFNSTGKTFYLMDTFQGIDPAYVTNAEKEVGILNYKYRDTYNEVIETFKSFKTVIIKGSIPATLNQCNVNKICYLSIDMNNLVPEIAALEYFWDKVVKGGVIILDDYGFPIHIEQKKAFDKFAAEKKHEILSLPTGQGLILKNH
jgi:hypothetical protein